MLIFYFQSAPNIVRECLETKWNETLQLLLFSLLGLSGHKTKELCELDQTCPIIIKLVDQVLQLIFCWILSKRFQNASQL